MLQDRSLQLVKLILMHRFTADLLSFRYLSVFADLLRPAHDEYRGIVTEFFATRNLFEFN